MHCRSRLVHVTVCIEAVVLVVVSTLVGHVYLRMVIVEMAPVVMGVHCERPAASLPSHRTIEVCHFVSNRILLDRESYDFGRPKWHLLETLKVPSTYRGMRIVYSYDDGFHDDFNVSEELNVEYYD